MVAGGMGGMTADAILHSVDTVKTRIQGQSKPYKYHDVPHAFRTLWREEGVIRGLYGGITPALLGSLAGTTIFFGSYELLKRALLQTPIPESAAHLTAAALGDFAASFVFVPSEVLKTRLQLQGGYNNPHFVSGYNYHGTWHAVQMILKLEGFSSLFRGYRATLIRDMPFSALQFAFYEKFKTLAQRYDVKKGDLEMWQECVVGGAAGSLAGALTTPLDVMKTIMQTQVKRPLHAGGSGGGGGKNASNSYPPVRYFRGVGDGLRWTWKYEGVKGLFRGLSPRLCLTGIQSSLMFVIYERLLSWMDARPIPGLDDW
ncbi:MAG: mitochondrial carrier domain-containing protein [Piptocephalis tieghemiana]|nr:MAG: mitochondrial carrier domain-containing protein [Piptocephalis tieghemiana]